jgi:hypothetical protein
LDGSGVTVDVKVAEGSRVELDVGVSLGTGVSVKVKVTDGSRVGLIVEASVREGRATVGTDGAGKTD